MHPDFSPDLAAYPAFVFAGVLVGVAVGVWRLHRAGLGFAACVRLEMVLVTAGLFGAKLYSLWERGGGPSWEVSELTGSYRYPGGIIAVALVLVLFRKRLLAGLRSNIPTPTGLAQGRRRGQHPRPVRFDAIGCAAARSPRNHPRLELPPRASGRLG